VRWISFVPTLVLLTLGGAGAGESCTLSVAPANFGEVDILQNSHRDTVTDISVTCAPGVAYQIRIDPGLHAREEFHARGMGSATGDATLAYNFYRNAARTEVLGDGIGSPFTITGIGKGATEIIRIYGRIPGRQNVRSDSYADSITVTLEW
jgi:spore coat protein U-like protein